MFDLDHFLQDCCSAAGEADSASAIKEVLARALSDPSAVQSAFGTPNVADMSVIYSGPEVTVCHAVWAPCMSLVPHNHNMPAVIGMYGGQEDNTFWRRTPHGLEQAGGRRLQQCEVALLDADVIHSVANPDRRYTAAIHVYVGDYLHAHRSEWDPQTFEERDFDMERSRRMFAEAEAEWRRRASEEEKSAALRG